MAKKIINVVYKVDSKELDTVKKSLQANQQEAKKFDDNLKKVDKSAQDAGKHASQSFLDFKNILGTISFAAIITGLTALGKKIFDLGVQQEQLNIAFTTFLGSAEKAKKLLAELTKFAIVTPFSPDQVNKAARTLLAFGTAAKDVIPTLKMIGDVSAGTGKDLAEMAVIFGQIQSTGRLMGQDLLQLINAGFNPLQIISEKTGKSVKTLKEEMEKGLISFDMVKQAFKDATTEGGLFFNLMEKQSESIGGKLSTVMGNLEEAGKNLFAQTTGPLKAFTDFLVEQSEKFMEATKGVQQADEELTQKIIDNHVRSKRSKEESIELLEMQVKKFFQTRKAGEALNESELRRLSYFYKAIGVIRTYNEEIDKTEKITSKAKKKLDLSSNETDLGAGAEMDKLVMKQAEEEFSHRDDMSKMLDNYNAEITKKIENQYDIEESIRKENTDTEVEDEQKKQDRIKAIKQQAFDFGIGLLGMILMASLQANRQEMDAIDEKYNHEIELAGNNEAARKNIEKRREQERKEALKRQQKDEREARIKTILAESLVNSIKALGLPPIPGANFLAAAQAIAYGAVQVGLVGKFKDGGWITGPGTPTSDSVPILASRDEFMVNAAAAAQSPNLLEAINDRKINDSVLRGLATSGGRQVNIFDDSNIVKAIKENKDDYMAHGYTLMKVEKSRTNFKRYIRSKVFG